MPKSEKIVLPGMMSYARRWRPGMGCYTVITKSIRRPVHDGYRRSAGSPGSITLPSELKSHDYYPRHLCSRRLLVNDKTKKEDWRRSQARDDLLDCKCHAHAQILRRYQDSMGDSTEQKKVPAADWLGGAS